MSYSAEQSYVNIGPLWHGALFEQLKAGPSPQALQRGVGAVSDRWKKQPGRGCPEKETVKQACFAC